MNSQDELTAAVQKAQGETERRRFLRRALGLGGIAGLSALMGWEGHRAYGAPSGNPRELGEDYLSFINTLLKEEDATTVAIRNLADTEYRDLKLREILAGTWKGSAIGDTYLSAAAQAAISASHAAVTVAGAPLTLATQAITFNKSTHFDLSGNALILKAAGHGSAQHDSTARIFKRYLISGVFDNSYVSTASTQTGVAGRVYLCPITVPTLMTFDTIGCEVSTKGEAATTVTLGIYPSSGDAPDGTAPSLSTTMAADGATAGFQEVTISDLQLVQGEYFAALETADTTIVVRKAGASAGTATVTNTKFLSGCYYDRSGGYGALTNPCPATSMAASCRVLVFLSVKSVDA